MRLSRLAFAALVVAVVVPGLPASLLAVCGGTPPPPPPPPPPGEVPPGSREPTDPAGPTTGGGGLPGGPTTGGGPDVGGPTTGGGSGGPSTGSGGRNGGPSTGPAPVGGNAGGPTTGRDRGTIARDRDDWKYWWFANRTEILDLHARAVAAAARTAEGTGATRNSDAIWRADARRALAGALADPERDVAAAAAIAVGKAGDTGETAALTRLLLDRKADLLLRNSAALGLGLLPGGDEAPATAARDALLTVARDRSERDGLRAVATYALGERREDRAVPGLFELARSSGSTWDVPASALSALGMSRCDLARSELERLLSPPKRTRDGEWMRRVYAAHGLARLGDAGAVPSVLAALDDDHPDVRRAAVLALAALAKPGDEAVRTRLLRVLEDDRDNPCRNMAALTLGRIGGAAAVKALRRDYDSGDQIHRTYAALALGLAVRSEPDPAIRKFLAREFEERDMLELRGALAIACGMARASEAAPTLRKIASSPVDPMLRGHAAIALGLLGDAEAGPFLIGLLESKADPNVQGEAALALGLLGDVRALDTLETLVERGSSHRVQAASAVALGRIGGERAAKAFSRLVADRGVHFEVREAAAIGLGLLLDRREGRSYVAVGADLNWYATTATVRELLDVH